MTIIGCLYHIGHNLAKFLKMTVFPEKTRQIGREGIDHGNKLTGSLFGRHITIVICKRLEIPLHQALTQPGLYKLLLAFMQVDTTLLIDKAANLFKIAVS